MNHQARSGRTASLFVVTVVVALSLLVGLGEGRAGPAEQQQQQQPQLQQQPQQQQQQPQQQQQFPSCRHKGRRYEAGERWATAGGQGCGEYECGEDGAVTTTWCSHFVPAPGCRMVRGDRTAPYPLCCPRLRCGGGGGGGV